MAAGGGELPWGPPDNEQPSLLAGPVLLNRSDEGALFLLAASMYSVGIELSFGLRLRPSTTVPDRDAYQHALAEENIGTSIHFLPVHTLTYYRERFPDQAPLPVAERAGQEVLSLPLSPAHSDEDIADAVDALRRVHARFTS